MGGVSFQTIAASYRELAAMARPGQTAAFLPDQFLDQARLVHEGLVEVGVPTHEGVGSLVDFLGQLYTRGSLDADAARAFLSSLAPYLPRPQADPAAEWRRLERVLAGGERHPTTAWSQGGGIPLQVVAPQEPGPLGRFRRWWEGVRGRGEAEPITAPDEVGQETLTGTIFHGPFQNLLVRSEVLEGNSTRVAVVPSKYQLLKVVARGGMGEVFLARDPSVGLGAGRMVAIKIIKQELPDAAKALLLQVFEREQRIQGTFESHRVARIYDTGLAADGRPFLVMPYYPLGNLEEWLEKEGPTAEVDQILSLFTEAVAAVAEAHRRGIVHADVKPGNFFIEKLDGRLSVCLGDWGIARTLDEIRKQLTTDGTQEGFSGTPGFIPLPTYLGGPDDEARDCYALAAMAYQMLTGLLPYDGESQTAIITQMIAGPPPAPPNQVRPDLEIPRGLEEVILKGLQFGKEPTDPKSGYPNATEMLFDLVMIRPKGLERQAEALLKEIEASEDKNRRRSLLTQAKGLLAQAIASAHSLYERYQNPKIAEWIVNTSSLLHGIARRLGDEREMRTSERTITRLAPGSPVAQAVTRPSGFTVYLDGEMPPQADPVLTLFEGTNEGGFLKRGRKLWEGKPPPPGQEWTIDLPPGPHRIRLIDRAGWLYPIEIPLPAYTPVSGRHRIRVPLYQELEVPRGWVVMPAGPAAVPIGEGSYAEMIAREDWRLVDKDLAVSPFVTEGIWYRFVEEVYGREGHDEAYAVTPTTWERTGRERIRQGMGMPTPEELGISKNRPVAHVTYKGGLKFVQYVVDLGHLKVPEWGPTPPRGTTYPNPDQARRLRQGNDARRRPHGDAYPIGGSYAARIEGWEAPGEILANEFFIGGIPVLDLPAFSVFDDENRPLVSFPWVATNLGFYLVNNDNPRFARAIGIPEHQLRERALIGGVDFTQPFPGTLSILRAEPMNFRGRVGIRLAAPLRPAMPTPTLESLVG